MTTQTAVADNVEMIVRFFYCGRGDTILLEARAGGWGLIDCNLTRCSQAGRRLRERIKEREIGLLEFVCLTHPDQDHYFGMKELLEECFCDHLDKDVRPRFKQFWDSGADLRALQAIADRMKKKGAAKRLGALYDFLSPLFARDAVKRIGLNELSIPLEQFGDFFFVALAPRRNRVDLFTGQKYREILQSTDERLQGPREQSNNLSVVLVLMHRTMPLNILFGGDATAEVWEQALQTWERLLRLPGFDSRVRHFSGVTVSHHGARGSLRPELYQDYCAAQKTIAVLSVGHSDPHHPHHEVLQMLKSQGIRAYATCQRTYVENRVEQVMYGLLPLGGEPVSTEPARSVVVTGLPVAGGRTERFPALPGHACADVEITVYSDGRIEASPPESLLQLG